MLLRSSSLFPDDVAVGYSEMSVRFFQNIWRHNPYTKRREDLKTQKEKFL
jgi:hypothetical protein